MFTKVYKEEDELLRGSSYNVASVYFHLKNKRDFFKSKNNGSCYDFTSHISKNTGMCEKTIKRAIKTLKKLGLISTARKGKVNHYSFPILDAIENNTTIEEVKETEFEIPNCQIPNTADYSASNDKEVEQPQPTEDMQTEGKEIAIEEEISNEFMEGLTNSTEDEMLETLLSDEELIEKVAKEFIEKEGDGGFKMYIELNSVNPKSDEFRVLSNRWKHKWERYFITEERVRLKGYIAERVCKIYFNRYKEVA